MNLTILVMYLFNHLIFSNFLKFENYVVWLLKMKYVIANLKNYLIFLITVFLKKKTRNERIGLFIFKIRNDCLIVINIMNLIKDILNKFNK